MGYYVFIFSSSNKHGNYVVCHSCSFREGKNWVISINEDRMHSVATHIHIRIHQYEMLARQPRFENGKKERKRNKQLAAR